jgi:hypothetical protein
MISTGQILAAAAITAVAVAAARWRPPLLVGAAVSAFVLIVVWRVISNAAGLNGDYVPLVSIGDTVCLVAGALGPAIIAAAGRIPGIRGWAPAVVGGIAGFVVNVLIL